MAGGVIIDGKFTANPDVYATLVYGQGAGQPPSQGAIAIVGEFPFLQQNTPYAFTSQSALEQVAPNLPLVKRIANAVYNPSNDPATPGVPRAVYLVSPKATTQATALLYDSRSAAALKLSAQIWGPRGNQTRYALAPNTGLGGTDVTITNNGYREVFRVPTESSVLTLAYDYPGATGGTAAYGFADDGAGSGVITATQNGDAELDITFARTLPDSTVVSSTDESWFPTDPANPPGPVVASALTFNADGATLTTATRLKYTIVGFNSLGVATTVTGNITTAGPGVIAAGDVPTATVWSMVTSVTLWTANNSDADVGSLTGNVVVSGTVFGTLGPTAETNLTTIADVITYVSGFSAYGFTATTGSPRAASIPVVELDQTATGGGASYPVTFAADLWKLKTTINSNSTLVQADYAPSSSYLPVYVPVAGIANYLAGGTVADASVDNWTAAYASLTWLDINSVLVFIDDDYAPAPNTTRAAQHAAALDHVIYMNGVGANPRDAWGAANAQETLSAITTRVVALNSQLFTLIEDEDYAVQYTGAAERLDPVWYALKLCSMVNGNPRTSLVGCHPRSLGFYRRDDLSTREGTSELLRSGVTCMIQPPGETGPKVQRWVTTYVTNTDPSRTEGAAVRSELDSIRGVQWAVRPPAGQTGTNAFGATLLAAARAELSRQVDAGVIASFDNASLKVTEYADRWSISYAFAPAFPVNFVLINATVSVPTSSFTAAA